MSFQKMSDSAGDVAYPIEQFEPLRLAAHHSRAAFSEEGADRVVIRLDTLSISAGLWVR